MKGYKKKAQTEIIGVAIIVIIIVVGGLVLLTMKSNKQVPTDSFTDPELAQSMLTAILNTKTERNIEVREIIKKGCYENRNDMCGSTSTSDCCEYARKTMENALQATLGKWGRSYRLTIVRGNEKRIGDIPENSKCNEFKEQEQPGISYIPPPPQIVITLEICKS
jgi:hypothetical protein